MKKLILIFTMIFTIGVSLAFADKSRFYENGSVIDTMYVDSPEGLRVRDKPSLKSNRLCGLTHQLPVKVVAIGREETIDGITAPWVEILIPQYAGIDNWSKYNTRTIDQIVFEAIQWGVSAKGTRFEQMYHDYWDPIMAEHQKQADAMK